MYGILLNSFLWKNFHFVINICYSFDDMVYDFVMEWPSWNDVELLLFSRIHLENDFYATLSVYVCTMQCYNNQYYSIKGP